MGRKMTYDKSDLAFACAQVKRHILNKVKTGTIKKLNKLYVLEKISEQKKLGLKGPRTLQNINYEFKGYLDDWYADLQIAVDALLNLPEEHPSAPPSPIDIANENQQLRAKIEKQQLVIRGLQTRLNNVSKEFGKFLETALPRWGKIDSALSEVMASAYDDPEKISRPIDKS